MRKGVWHGTDISTGSLVSWHVILAACLSGSIYEVRGMICW